MSRGSWKGARVNWAGLGSNRTIQFECGWCGTKVGSSEGVGGTLETVTEGRNTGTANLRVCTHCTGVTVIVERNVTYGNQPPREQIPGKRLGRSLKHLPTNEIKRLYDEMRDCFAAGCWTATVTVGRILLMHVGVSLGAPANERFITYVDNLEENAHVPPLARGWVDEIRVAGNTANHELDPTYEKLAAHIVRGVEGLLLVNYELVGEQSELDEGDES